MGLPVASAFVTGPGGAAGPAPAAPFAVGARAASGVVTVGEALPLAAAASAVGVVASFRAIWVVQPLAARPPPTIPTKRSFALFMAGAPRSSSLFIVVGQVGPRTGLFYHSVTSLLNSGSRDAGGRPVMN